VFRISIHFIRIQIWSQPFRRILISIWIRVLLSRLTQIRIQIRIPQGYPFLLDVIKKYKFHTIKIRLLINQCLVISFIYQKMFIFVFRLMDVKFFT
jgi:hypothetical protein